MRTHRIVPAMLVVALSLTGAAILWPHTTEAVGAGSVTYSVKLKKGVSKTVLGDAFGFTGSGTMTVDADAGTFSYSLELSNGLTFSGQGTAVQTVDDEVFGTATTGSGSIVGAAIFTGKLKRDGQKFAGGKLYAAIPNRLGAPPDGFVYTTAKLTGIRQ